MTHYKNHTIEVQDAADGSATIIGSILDASAPIEQDVQSDSVAGTFYPQQVQVVNQKPAFRFNTLDIPKVIAAFGVTGKTIVSDTGKVGVAMYQAKYANSALVAGSNHRRLIFDESYAMVSRISVSHRQDARAECSAMAIWDGTNNPIVIGTAVALPTLPASAGRWTIGKVTIGGVLITCNIQVDIDFGITTDLFGCDSDIWDTHLNLDDIKPKISITSLDVENFGAATVPLIGLAGTHANTTIYLRKRTTSGLASFVGDATAEHIKITAAGILLCNEAMSASGNKQGQAQLEMTCTYDGTNTPLVFNTASAIT